ncbi:MAG: peptide-methionine (R)-S-oxide reductase [Pseudomonadales bacterium]|nr:peptide-methionine (R)-S-oxide reductase [Pseudomonadales bacterium]
MSEKRNELSQQEQHVILHKGTESPFSGEYDSFFEAGRYVCKPVSYTHLTLPTKLEV